METKQVIVIRKDLNMRRGKEIAQGSHASMAFLTRRLDRPHSVNPLVGYSPEKGSSPYWDVTITLSVVEMEWIRSSFKKITLQVNSEEELLDVERRAKEAGLGVHVVTDSGLTEFNGVPTRTCLAIGPDYEDKIDAVTGNLKLY